METRRIWKYELEITDEQTVNMPMHADILTVQMQGGTMCMWALVEPENVKRPRKFLVVGTGNPMPDGMQRYVGTVQMMQGSLVWHIFEAE
jgi:hypothetical protein